MKIKCKKPPALLSSLIVAFLTWLSFWPDKYGFNSNLVWYRLSQKVEDIFQFYLIFYPETLKKNILSACETKIWIVDA